MIKPNTETYLPASIVAERIGVDPSTLRLWRLKGTGPAWIKFGSAVRYPESALDLWIASCPRGGDL